MIWVGRITVTLATLVLVSFVDALGAHLIRDYSDRFFLVSFGKLLIVASFIAGWHGIGIWINWIWPTEQARGEEQME